MPFASKMFLLLLFFISLLVCLPASGNEIEVDYDDPNYYERLRDSLPLCTVKYEIVERQFDVLQLDTLRQNPDYDYWEAPKVIEEEEEDITDKSEIKASDTNEEETEFFSEAMMERIGQIVVYGIIVIMGGLILYQLFKTQALENIFRPQKQPDYNLRYYEEMEKDIYALNFPKLMQEALSKQQYRRAIRLQYLRSLKLLADQSLINWQLDKTNDKYVEELQQKKASYYPHFQKLTRLFNYTWYGNFSIQEDTFTSINKEFETFQQQVKPS